MGAREPDLALLASDLVPLYLVALDPASFDVGAREPDLALLASDLVLLYLVALDLAALERDPNWRR